jgi:hypothetical protein
MSCRGIALATIGALAMLAAPSAVAQSGTGGTAPAYPGNTLALEQIAPIVAGTTTKVRLSGHAQWNEPTDDLTIPYTLSIYVQNADVDPRCEPSKGAQLQKAINVATLGASESITDFVLDDDFNVRPSPPNPGIDWAIDSLPFVVTPGVSHVLLCGYQRYVTDDVAWYQLPVTVSQPTCSLARGCRSARPGALDLVQLHRLAEGELPPRATRSRQGRQARRHGQGARVDREPVARSLQRVDDEWPADGARRQAQDRARALTLSCPAPTQSSDPATIAAATMAAAAARAASSARVRVGVGGRRRIGGCSPARRR